MESTSRLQEMFDQSQFLWSAISASGVKKRFKEHQHKNVKVLSFSFRKVHEFTLRRNNDEHTKITNNISKIILRLDANVRTCTHLSGLGMTAR
jgi:hypothetical protein